MSLLVLEQVLFNAEKKDRTGGGIGGKITPSAVIVIQDGKTKLVNIKNQDTITKLWIWYLMW